MSVLCPEVMIEPIPSSQLAALVDQHGGLGAAVVGQLLVGRVGGHQGQLDRVDGVGLKDLGEEAGIDHGGLGSVGAHQVDGLGLVLLPLRCVLVNDLADGDGVGQHTRHQPLETVEDLLVPGEGLLDVLPPVLDVVGLLGQQLADLLVHLPPVSPALHLSSLLGPLHLAQLVRQTLGHGVGETLNNLVNSLTLQVGLVLLTLNVHLVELLKGHLEGQPGLLLHVLVKHLALPKHLIWGHKLPVGTQYLGVLLTELGWRVLGTLGRCHVFSLILSCLLTCKLRR